MNCFKMSGEIPLSGTERLNVHIRHLREKIESNPKEPAIY